MFVYLSQPPVNPTLAHPTDGFRKIPILGSNGSEDQRTDVAQFYHVNFMRSQEQRLVGIRRKVS